MQKIFDFENTEIKVEKSASSSVLITKALKEKNDLLNISISDNSLQKSPIKKSSSKWSTIEPPKLVKSNMSFTSTKSNLIYKKTSFVNNSPSETNSNIRLSNSGNSLNKNKFKTFDDVQIVLNDDQLKEFRELIDKLFKRVRLYVKKLNRN